MLDPCNCNPSKEMHNEFATHQKQNLSRHGKYLQIFERRGDGAVLEGDFQQRDLHLGQHKLRGPVSHQNSMHTCVNGEDCQCAGSVYEICGNLTTPQIVSLHHNNAMQQKKRALPLAVVDKATELDDLHVVSVLEGLAHHIQRVPLSHHVEVCHAAHLPHGLCEVSGFDQSRQHQVGHRIVLWQIDRK